MDGGGVKARLADIAAHADVSEATVSRVLNGKPGVAESTRQAVLTALDVLGYDRPSRLRRKSAGLVGLVVPELSNPIFPMFAQIIETALARHRFTPVLCTQTPGGVHEDEYVQMLLDRGVAGIIYISGQHADTTTDPERYTKLRQRGLPIVLVNGYHEGIDAPFISNDEVASMDLALGHLVALGHTQIGLAVGPDRYVPVIRKITGFRASMKALLGRDDVEDLIERTMFSLEGGDSAASRLIEKGCTAVVCGSDLMALGAVRAARRAGLEVPGDFSVVGYDDSPLIAFTDPPLTTIRQSVQAMSEAAVRALLDEIAGEPAPRAEYIFRPELVVRGSTGACRPRAAAVSRRPAPEAQQRAQRFGDVVRGAEPVPRRALPGPHLDADVVVAHHLEGVLVRDVVAEVEDGVGLHLGLEGHQCRALVGGHDRHLDDVLALQDRDPCMPLRHLESRAHRRVGDRGLLPAGVQDGGLGLELQADTGVAVDDTVQVVGEPSEQRMLVDGERVGAFVSPAALGPVAPDPGDRAVHGQARELGQHVEVSS